MSSNPPSAAKNGTWVVPACVTSGPSPETAALRIRSSWTSQPTSSTLTLIPVFCSNGATIFSVSATGLGPLFMIQRRTVCPLRSFAGALLALALALALDLVPLSSSLLPHAATMSDNTVRATATTTVARLLRISLLLLLPNMINKNVYDPACATDGVTAIVAAPPQLRTGGGAVV